MRGFLIRVFGEIQHLSIWFWSSRAGRLGCAILLTWVFYVGLNAAFYERKFSHLDSFPTFTVGDMVRVERIATGANEVWNGDLRKNARVGPTANRLYVVGCSPEVACKSLKADNLGRIQRLVSDEYANPDIRVGGNTSPALRPLLGGMGLAIGPVLSPALIGGVGLAVRAEATPIVLDPSAEHALVLFQLLKLRSADPITLGPKIDPWLKSLCEFDPATGFGLPQTLNRVALENFMSELPRGFTDGQLTDEKRKRYRRLLSRFVIGGNNIHLLNETLGPDGLWAAPTSGARFTVLYGRADTFRYWAALEISIQDRPFKGIQDMGGWDVMARFAVCDSITGKVFQSSRTRIIPVLTRQNRLWFGLRPSAVLISENQLATRFSSEIRTIQSGAAITGELGPEKAEERFCQEYIAQVLRERLGRDGVPAGQEILTDEVKVSDRHLDRHPQPMESWIEWPRRLNGGTWWGRIQFIIILVFCWFILELTWETTSELARQERDNLISPFQTSLRVVGLTAGGAVRLRKAATDALDGRAWFLWYLSASLPLLGFFGTVVGLSISLVGASGVSARDEIERQSALQSMTVALGTAFDKSFFAFLFSLFTTLGCYWLARRNAVEADHL